MKTWPYKLLLMLPLAMFALFAFCTTPTARQLGRQVMADLRSPGDGPATTLSVPDLSKPPGYVRLPGGAALFDPRPRDVPPTDAEWSPTLVVIAWE